MQRVIAASVRCYGLAAPGAALRARGKASSATSVAASGAGAWIPNRAAPTSCAPGRLGASRRAVRVARAISTDTPAVADAATSTGKPSGASVGPTFQDAILRLQQYWSSQGCALWLPHNTEVGAGTMNPATFLRALGPEPWSVCYPEPSIRPDDSRYGDNPNRVQRHTQFQVILKPDPGDAQELYLGSLEALGIDTSAHDLRFVEDNWESPVLGAWGLGWEVWLDGMEVTQFTYFQQCGSLKVTPTAVEITYGLERILMSLQGVDHFKDIRYNDHLTYGEMLAQNEYEMSVYNMEAASVVGWQKRFELADEEANAMLARRLPLPAFDNLLKASHAFNILDARGAVGVTERQKLFASMRKLARESAKLWVTRREELGFPLGEWEIAAIAAPVVSKKPPPTEAADFFIELGTEELPAADVSACAAQMLGAIKATLDASGLTHEGVTVGATPRRTVVRVAKLAAAQSSGEERLRGPPQSRAFEKDGVTPTKAVLGFCNKNGIGPEDLEKDGEYVWANVVTVGVGAVDVFREALPGVIGGLNFPKTMRWNSEETFSRPVRWLLAMHGEHHIPFVAAGVPSGDTTRLMRNSATPVVAVTGAAHHATLLAGELIEISMDKRRDAIWRGAVALAESVNGVVPPSSGEPGGLLDEVVNLVEAATPILGSFKPEFLALPKEVLVIVMRKHQRYFPVEDPATGELLPHFITIANGAVDHDAVRLGNESVLTARYQDAQFFYAADTKKTLADFKPSLEGITFQTKLGTMLDKTKRLELLAPLLAKQLGFSPQDASIAKQAASLAKADLATSLVTEFTSLAGVMGAHYARREGLDSTLCDAIFEAVLPRSAGDQLPQSRAGITVAVADRFDTLVGLFAVVGAPKATADPFGLRRAAYGAVQALVASNTRCDARLALSEAASLQPVKVAETVVNEVMEYITRRLEQYLVDGGCGVEAVRAALAERGDDPAFAAATAIELDTLVKRKGSDSDELKTAMAVLARPTKLVRGKDLPFDLEVRPGSFETAEETALYDAYVAARESLGDAASASVGDLLQASSSLAEPVEQFFDKVFVMADDPELRRNRLALVNAVASLPKGIVDFAELPGF
jgi:glycyl-tRNA synthetase